MAHLRSLSFTTLALLLGCSSDRATTTPHVSESGGAFGTGGSPFDGAGGAHTGSSAGGAEPRDASPDQAPGPHHFSIVFDYRYDTLGFFKPAERRASLEAAAALWTAVIQDDFPAVPKGTHLKLNDPEHRDTIVSVDGIEQDIDDVIVFVGTSDSILPAYGRSSPAETAITTDQALAMALAARVNGTDFEPWAGSVTFATSANWYFKADQIPAGSDSYDFQSFAVHELGHVLGFTPDSAAFQGWISGTTFTGPKAKKAYGGPVPLMSVKDLAHLLTGTLSEGTKALMNLSITNGQRELPTKLDLAVLSDVGYEITP